MEGEQACGDHSQDRRNYHDRVQTKWKQHQKESFIRNGRGYWIDEETRIATREVEWKDGVEVNENGFHCAIRFLCIEWRYPFLSIVNV